MSLLRHRCVATVLSVLAVLFSGGIASIGEAQDHDGVREQAAFESLQSASRAYDEGEYETALSELDAAWILFPAPAILFNRGRTLEALGRLEEAITAYEQYLEQDENPHNPDAVRGAIVRLQAEVAAADAARAEVEAAEIATPVETIEPPDEIVPDPPTERSSSAPAWILFGSGAAIAVAGTVFWGLASGDNTTARGLSHQESFPDFATQERAEDRALIGNILVPVGSALLAGGLVWLIVRAAGSNEVAAQPGGLAVRF